MLVKAQAKITEEDYNKLLVSTYAEISDYVSDIANGSTSPPCAYGFLSPDYFMKDGEYFVSWKHYDSCD